MISSMTAYGRGEIATETEKVLIEIRGVNHRFMDVQVRLPRVYLSWNEKIRKLIQGSGIKRGRIEVIIQLEESPEKSDRPLLNETLARNYYQALKELCYKIGLNDEPKLSDLLSIRDVFEVPEEEDKAERLWSLVEKALQRALETFIEMRKIEGENLAKDIQKRLERIGDLLQKVKEFAPGVVEQYRERIRKRILELLPEDKFDENRLLQEVAIFADRSDITEELVRAESHVGQFKEILKNGGTIGKKMEFLLQELLREINTIGSKANSVDIAGLVVEMKNEVEKIREQVQNIE